MQLGWGGVTDIVMGDLVLDSCNFVLKLMSDSTFLKNFGYITNLLLNKERTNNCF